MSKRNTDWDENKIQRYISEGRGKGEGKNYKPWLTIQDVPSDGRVTRCQGWKTKRIHHLMSDHETRYFFLLEWATDVVDILEQFPLEREKTCKIAENKGIRYPQDTKTKTPLVLTTDFLIKVKQNQDVKYFARTIKPSSFLETRRVIEKFEIEREYWKQKEVNWAIVTEKDIPIPLAKNIEWMHSAYWLEDIDDYHSTDCQKLIHILLMQFERVEQIPMIDLLTQLDAQHNLNPGSFLFIFRHCLSRRFIQCDLTNKFDLRKPIDEFKVINPLNDYKERWLNVGSE